MSIRSTVPVALAIGCMVSAGVSTANALGGGQLPEVARSDIVPVASQVERMSRSSRATRAIRVTKGMRITPTTSPALRRAILSNPRYNASINACWG